MFGETVERPGVGGMVAMDSLEDPGDESTGVEDELGMADSSSIIVDRVVDKVDGRPVSHPRKVRSRGFLAFFVGSAPGATPAILG